MKFKQLKPARQADELRRGEKGQMTIIMVLALPVVFLLFSLALDAGIWFFDHRLAQNQTDAAALAAVQLLPNTDDTLARATAINWLEKNGSSAAELCAPDENGPYPQFMDTHPAANPDGRFDQVRVCVRRQSDGIFAGLADLDFVFVSAVTTARLGPVGSIANVMPWGLVPPDGTCNTINGEQCQYDMNNDGIIAEDGTEDCGTFPPLIGSQSLCPWGLHEDRLYVFKPGDTSSDDIYTPGNFGPISACGLGAVEYVDCIEGELATGFYAEGETVNIATQTGDLGANTPHALESRYAEEEARGYPCDIESTPDLLTGLDPDGKRRAAATFVEERDPYWDANAGPTGEWVDFISGCDFRLVSIPILEAFPPQGGSEDILVLGVSTFAIAGWDRSAQYGNAVGDTGYACDDPPPGPPPAEGDYFECGYVWGYLIADAFPPDTLVNSIAETANPFAPLLIALVE